MNLEDFSAFQKIDPENMLGAIDGLPDQLETAWQLGQNQPLPTMTAIRTIVVAGMGGSAIGADLIAAYVAPQCPVPIIVHRNYSLPAWAQGPETLVIASSHSGNTEETLSAYQRAREKGCQILAITTGGKLSQLAQQDGVPAWIFEHPGQPRAAVGFSFGLLLALLFRLGMINDPSQKVASAVNAMREQQKHLRADVPVAQNPAKRLAGQLMGRWVTVMGADFLEPVARRWKGQISEVAKAWAQFEFLPEADHNTLAGIINPEKVLSQAIFLFLSGSSDYQRNAMRIDLTRKGFMQEGLNTDLIQAQGTTPLEQMWTTLHLGDYTAYYLAMAYGVDPSPVPAIEGLKAAMK